jgi:lipopolysaccharide transport system permease protein
MPFPHPSIASADIGPLAPFRTAWRHRVLIGRLAAREIAARYRGSVLGLAWMIANPLLMLSVYTFVFTVVFKARWGSEGGGSLEFAVYLFSGMVLFGVLSDCLTRAPTLMLENVSYIKKVVFPLEILPLAVMAGALANAGVGLVILLIFQTAAMGPPPLTALATPLVVAPLLMLALGLSWFLASLGVFLRDVRQMVGVLVTVLMFLSPIFYPLDALPEEFRAVILLNPMTIMLEQSKDVLFRGRLPSPASIAAACGIGWSVMWLGYAWFNKTRKGFADVV